MYQTDKNRKNNNIILYDTSLKLNFMCEIIRLLMFLNLICSYIRAQKFDVIFEIFSYVKCICNIFVFNVSNLNLVLLSLTPVMNM